MPCDKLINCDAESPKVNALVVASSKVDLRSQVVVGSNDGQHVSPLSSLEGSLGNSEINYFYFS